MGPIAGPGREPRLEMSAGEAVELLTHLGANGVDVWLDGGWAVDAALGMQTREHDDLDLIVELQHVERLETALRDRGYAVVRGAPPTSFELTDCRGRQVDVHPVVFVESGDGVYRLENGENWIYPASGFAGVGCVLGRRVRCLTPEVQMLCHTGYEPHRTSFDDATALGRRFGIPVPEAYRLSAECYPRRAG
jgi:lincosamide nucleotidyltransferase A/C/D/E